MNVGLRRRFFWVALVVSLLAAAVSVAGERRTMLVHLPDAPIESMGRLGEAVSQLATYVQTAVPDLSLEVKAFRKAEDALSFLESQKESVALVVCDPAFLLDLPDGFEVDHRFVRRGKQTERKIVVVKSDSGFTSLADLRGRSLTVVLSSTAAGSRFLTENVFRNEIDANQWFSAIAHETDDFSAVASLLYGRTDSALISEDNPLVKSHLGKDLAQVYASGPISLSVIAVRSGARPLAARGSRAESRRSRGKRGSRADSSRPHRRWIPPRRRVPPHRRLSGDGEREAGARSGRSRRRWPSSPEHSHPSLPT